MSDIDLMVRVKGRGGVPGWNLLSPQSQISSAPGAPASTSTSSRSNNVPVDRPVYPSQDPANVRRDAENGQHHVHPIDNTRDERPDTQSCTSRKPQGSDSQSSLSSGAQKPREPPSQRERPTTAGGLPAHSASQTSSSPRAPASTHTSLVDVPAKIPQDRPIVREDAARGQHAINSTQSRVSRNPQGSDHQSLSSEVQKPGEHSPQREITARASPTRFASQTSSPSAPASTPTSSRLDDVPIVPVNIPQGRPTVRDAAKGQLHAINNTREGRPSDTQGRTSGYPQGSELRGSLSSEAQKPGERFQEKHATTPGKSTTHYAGQNSRPPSVLASKPVDSSINVTFNVSQAAFVLPATTPPPLSTLAQNTPAFPAPKSKPAPPPRSKGWMQTFRDKIGW
ncbi:hypothetical protein BJV78DRAFT_950504 [Lactifluus subvellereus]|nr:hypothetical protein BJV78DRAFT_950504 [Lactifluus subvellereus]